MSEYGARCIHCGVGGGEMKIVLMRSPKALAPLLRRVFGVPKKRK